MVKKRLFLDMKFQTASDPQYALGKETDLGLPPSKYFENVKALDETIRGYARSLIRLKYY